jgi:para-nitrobenzyl esterase
MPSAKGLFHKAVIQSGSTLTQLSPEEAHKNTEKFLAKAGMKAADLQTAPADKLLAAMTAAGMRLGPVVDGKALPRHPFDPAAPDVSSDVPVIIGTTETEGTYFAQPDLLSLDEAAMRSRLRERLGSGSDQVVDLFRKSRPKATPSQLYFTILAFPTKANLQAERKAALAKAPAYLYEITWKTPVQDGSRFSPHCLEIPFVFNNVWHMPELVGTGPDIQPLADKISGAWVAFARNGSPNHSGIPQWPVFSASQRPAMKIDTEWKVVNDFNREERLAMARLTDLPMV